MAAPSEPQTQVRFTTRLEAHLRVSETPIQLPTRLTRYGLSEVVNHLLGADEARPFDFVVDGELLRGSLAKYLKKAGLTGEDILTLEYIELLVPPEPQGGAAHDDWVAALASRTDEAGAEEGQGAQQALMLSGCYNGCAYVRNAAGEALAELRGHTAAVKGVAWLPALLDADEAGGAPLRAVSASKDHTLRVWSMQRSGKGGEAGWTATCEAICTGHDDSVEAVAASPAGDGTFCSAGWDGTLRLWDATQISAATATGAASAPAKPKRAKRSSAAASDAAPPPELSSQLELRGHADCVSGVAWPTAAVVYSCSWDGTIKEWDVPTATASTSISSGKAATCVDVSLLSSLVASGHSDHVLRLWDARAPQAAQLSLRHRGGWVSGVAWSRHRAQLLASACHDGTVRLWDTRSTVPLHELPPHADKALCVAWDGAERLLSGGADGELRTLQLRLPAQ